MSTKSGSPCLIKPKFCWTASAVPAYQSELLRALYGVRILMPPVKSRFRSHGAPEPMCSISDCGRYCASTIRSRMPELTQFDNGKSMIRYFPAKGTAGFVRFAVSAPSLDPSPPARITARVFIVTLILREGQDYLDYE